MLLTNVGCKVRGDMRLTYSTLEQPNRNNFRALGIIFPCSIIRKWSIRSKLPKTSNVRNGVKIFLKSRDACFFCIELRSRCFSFFFSRIRLLFCFAQLMGKPLQLSFVDNTPGKTDNGQERADAETN